MRSPNCPKGKVALASAPSASSAILLGTCRGGREQVDICRRNRGYAGTSGLSIRVSTGCTIADAADGADGVFGK